MLLAIQKFPLKEIEEVKKYIYHEICQVQENMFNHIYIYIYMYIKGSGE